MLSKWVDVCQETTKTGTETAHEAREALKGVSLGTTEFSVA
jgi:hypothetical protein